MHDFSFINGQIPVLIKSCFNTFNQEYTNFVIKYLTYLRWRSSNYPVIQYRSRVIFVWKISYSSFKNHIFCKSLRKKALHIYITISMKSRSRQIVWYSFFRSWWLDSCICRVISHVWSCDSVRYDVRIKCSCDTLFPNCSMSSCVVFSPRFCNVPRRNATDSSRHCSLSFLEYPILSTDQLRLKTKIQLMMTTRRLSWTTRRLSCLRV